MEERFRLSLRERQKKSCRKKKEKKKKLIRNGINVVACERPSPVAVAEEVVDGNAVRLSRRSVPFEKDTFCCCSCCCCSCKARERLGKGREGLQISFQASESKR